RFERWVNLLRLDLRIAHSSGHADRETLIEIINEIRPRVLIPVHTESPQEFQRLAEAGEISCEVLLPSPAKLLRLAK
ncbi:MAG: MBL fold metallo-hydrolase RNA specificity domain-containing protein, partial [Nitrososphaerota archaeon]